MKKYINIAFALLFAVLMNSCAKDDIFGPGQYDGETGSLSTRNMLLEIDNAENEVRSGSSDLSNFIIDILKDGEKVQTYTYAEMPEVLTLPVGDYTVRARSHELTEEAQWAKPYYKGEQDFTIKAKEITEVQTVNCKLSNVRVTILFDEDLKQVMDADACVNVVVGEVGTLDFGRDENRSGFFPYIENSQTLVATFKGKVDGQYLEYNKPYTDVKPGNHYKITFHYHDGQTPGASGAVSPGISVNATVEVETISANVEAGMEDLLTDDLRPVNGEKPSDPGTDPTPGGNDPVNPPAAGGPSITVNAPLVFEVPNDVDSTSPVELLIKSDSPAGFTAFNVELISNALTPDELSGFGLSDNMDLVNDKEICKALADPLLGLLPEDCINGVGGKTELLLSITNFMAPLAGVGAGDTHTFRLTVKDANGTTVKNLLLRFP